MRTEVVALLLAFAASGALAATVQSKSARICATAGIALPKDIVHYGYLSVKSDTMTIAEMHARTTLR